LQRVRNKVFRTTGTICIEPLASRSPPAFHENSESSGESKDGHLLKQKRYRRGFSGFRWDPKRGNGQSKPV
jgi:hypothetical protein